MILFITAVRVWSKGFSRTAEPAPGHGVLGFGPAAGRAELAAVAQGDSPGAADLVGDPSWVSAMRSPGGGFGPGSVTGLGGQPVLSVTALRRWPGSAAAH